MYRLYAQTDLLSTFYELTFRIAELVLVVLTVALIAGLVNCDVTLFLVEFIVHESTRFAQVVSFKQQFGIVIVSQFVLRVQIKALIFHEQLL
jgi:hypothetical protein